MGSYLTLSFKYLSVQLTSVCIIDWIAWEGACSSCGVWIGDDEAELVAFNIKLSTPGRIRAASSGLDDEVEFKFSETSADVTGSGDALLYPDVFGASVSPGSSPPAPHGESERFVILRSLARLKLIGLFHCQSSVIITYRFWNQIFTWRSDRPSCVASSDLLQEININIWHYTKY